MPTAVLRSTPTKPSRSTTSSWIATKRPTLSGLSAMGNGQLTDRCTRICAGHVEGCCRAPMRFPQRALALDQRPPRSLASEQQCVLGHRAAEHSFGRTLRSLAQSDRVQTASGVRPTDLSRQPRHLPFGIGINRPHHRHSYTGLHQLSLDLTRCCVRLMCDSSRSRRSI